MIGSWFSEMCISTIRRKKINEYKELQDKLYEKLELWRYEIQKNDLTVIMEYELCVGKFASYNIYIPGLHSVWIDELKKIKGYDMWYISSWMNGIKLSCSSLRCRDQTTRELQNVSSVSKE